MTNITVQNEQQAVKQALNAWITSVEGQDMNLLPTTVAHDPDIVWIGTSVNDWIVGWDGLNQAMQAQNAALDGISISTSDETLHVHPEARFAWATNRWVFKATMSGQQVELPLRCTWVLEKREAGWVIVHFHKSVGMAE
jgi:ketosteroid isomerase-like protein